MNLAPVWMWQREPAMGTEPVVYAEGLVEGEPDSTKAESEVSPG